MNYNWQQKDWKTFRFDFKQIEDLILCFQEQLGYMKGRLLSLSKEQKAQTVVDILVSEAVKNAEIEGEFLSRQDVMSSIKYNLGIDIKTKPAKDLQAKGMAKVVSDIHQRFKDRLTEEDLFAWHSELFPHPTSLKTGTWRTSEHPMQVVSGTYGKEKVHFEAPPSSQIPNEMNAFIDWFNETAPKGNKSIKYAPIRSAITHLYFETIHPFEDGNGRIGRAIAEKALLQTVDFPLLISLSFSIESDRRGYYQALKTAQRSNDITAWLKYFIQVILDAQKTAENVINLTLQKTKLFDTHKNQLNPRQTKVLQRMFDAGVDGFEGGMSAKKYIEVGR